MTSALLLVPSTRKPLVAAIGRVHKMETMQQHYEDPAAATATRNNSSSIATWDTDRQFIDGESIIDESSSSFSFMRSALAPTSVLSGGTYDDDQEMSSSLHQQQKSYERDGVYGVDECKKEMALPQVAIEVTPLDPAPVPLPPIPPQPLIANVANNAVTAMDKHNESAAFLSGSIESWDLATSRGIGSGGGGDQNHLVVQQFSDMTISLATLNKSADSFDHKIDQTWRGINGSGVSVAGGGGLAYPNLAPLAAGPGPDGNQTQIDVPIKSIATTTTTERRSQQQQFSGLPPSFVQQPSIRGDALEPDSFDALVSMIDCSLYEIEEQPTSLVAYPNLIGSSTLSSHQQQHSEGSALLDAPAAATATASTGFSFSQAQYKMPAAPLPQPTATLPLHASHCIFEQSESAMSFMSVDPMPSVATTAAIATTTAAAATAAIPSGGPMPVVQSSYQHPQGGPMFTDKDILIYKSSSPTATIPYHAGNAVYLQEIKRRHEEYVRAMSDADKSDIRLEMMRQFQALGYRFLKQGGGGSNCDNNDSVWTAMTEVDIERDLCQHLSQKCFVECTSDRDVRMGRGGHCTNHPGNQRFLNKKDEMRVAYLAEGTDAETKRQISQDLVDWVYETGGKFVDEFESRWYIVGNEAARRKAMQALREKRKRATK